MSREHEYRGLNPVKRLSHCSCHKITGGKPPGLLERILMLLVPHFDIIKSPEIRKPGGFTEVVVYLRRFYLFRSKWFGLNFGDLYLHHIIRSDDDPDPHDHPWGFRGIILAGGYIDHRYEWFPACTVPDRILITLEGEQIFLPGYESKGSRSGPFPEVMKPRSFVSRDAEHIHQVIVPEGQSAWTLIVTSKYSRDWNFITKDGPVMWRKYLNIPDHVDVGE